MFLLLAALLACDAQTDSGETGQDSELSCPSGDAIDCDGDGFTIDVTSRDYDCDDTDPDIYPGAPGGCDGIDNNCDGEIDGPGEEGLYYEDDDRDTWGGGELQQVFCIHLSDRWVERGGDCLDDNADVNPGADEECGWPGEGRDDDCDGEIDEGCELE